MPRRSTLVLLAVCAFALLHAGWLSQTLPATVASHFDAAGHPNAWMPRSLFVRVYAGLTVGLTLLFLFLSWATSALGPGRINLPNRDYWLSPERREETMAWLADFNRWMATGTLVLIGSIMQLAADASRTASQELGRGGMVLVGAFVAFSLLMLARLTLHFARGR
jgi:Protein of unknown function (DUF1648)